jgi:hypothetical protein
MKQLLHLPRRSGKVHRSEKGGLTESHLSYLKEKNRLAFDTVYPCRKSKD